MYLVEGVRPVNAWLLLFLLLIARGLHRDRGGPLRRWQERCRYRWRRGLGSWAGDGSTRTPWGSGPIPSLQSPPHAHWNIPQIVLLPSSSFRFRYRHNRVYRHTSELQTKLVKKHFYSNNASKNMLYNDVKVKNSALKVLIFKRNFHVFYLRFEEKLYII